MKKIGNLFFILYKYSLRVKARTFSLLISGAFANFGTKSVIIPPARLGGINRISIGDKVYIGARSWIQTLSDCKGSIGIDIGNGISIGNSVTISAAYNITIGDNTIIASNACILDHMHRYDEIQYPISSQGINKVSPVMIGKNSWIGQNVVILPGVNIGKNSVIGANSVVNKNVPDYSVAAGAPAKVIKSIANF